MINNLALFDREDSHAAFDRLQNAFDIFDSIEWTWAYADDLGSRIWHERYDRVVIYVDLNDMNWREQAALVNAAKALLRPDGKVVVL